MSLSPSIRDEIRSLYSSDRRLTLLELNPSEKEAIMAEYGGPDHYLHWKVFGVKWCVVEGLNRWRIHSVSAGERIGEKKK